MNYCVKTRKASHRQPMKHKEIMDKIKEDSIKRLINSVGGCMATDKITVDGELVDFMYREQPDFDSDSGWRFLSGTETQAIS